MPPISHVDVAKTAGFFALGLAIGNLGLALNQWRKDLPKDGIINPEHALNLETPLQQFLDDAVVPPISKRIQILIGVDQQANMTATSNTVDFVVNLAVLGWALWLLYWDLHAWAKTALMDGELSAPEAMVLAKPLAKFLNNVVRLSHSRVMTVSIDVINR